MIRILCAVVVCVVVVVVVVVVAVIASDIMAVVTIIMASVPHFKVGMQVNIWTMEIF